MTNLHKEAHFTTLQAALFIAIYKQGGLVHSDTPTLLCPQSGTQQASHSQAVITGKNMTRLIFRWTDLVPSTFFSTVSCLTTDPIIALNALFSNNFCFPTGDMLLSTSLPPIRIPAEYSLIEAGLTSLEVTLSGFQGSAKKIKTL